MKCKICGREIKGEGNFKLHLKKCEYLLEIKDEIYDLYVNKEWEVKKIIKNIGFKILT
jgi:hypothetical protein